MAPPGRRGGGPARATRLVAILWLARWLEKGGNIGQKEG